MVAASRSRRRQSGHVMQRTSSSRFTITTAAPSPAAVFTGLASKSVTTVCSGLASKHGTTVFSSLTSKLVVTVSFGLVLKPAVGFLVEPQNQGGGEFFGLGVKIGSSDLVIWVSKSPRRFLGLGLKIKWV
jgi:hypothetical protein